MSAVPNALSALRALLALPLVWAVVAGAQAVALSVFALAAVSDVLDGQLARRLARARVAKPAGGGGDSGHCHGAFFDVGADAVFLVSGLTALWALGALPAWVPLVAVSMLARFFATSPSAGLVYDPVGRHYGTLLYVLLGVWILDAPAAALSVSLAVLVVATGASVLARTRYLRGRVGVTTWHRP